MHRALRGYRKVPAGRGAWRPRPHRPGAWLPHSPCTSSKVTSTRAFVSCACGPREEAGLAYPLGLPQTLLPHEHAASHNTQQGQMALHLTLEGSGGEARIRTGDKGFAGLCLTTWPLRHICKRPILDRPVEYMERATGFEPATSTLARLRATNCAKPASQEILYARRRPNASIFFEKNLQGNLRTANTPALAHSTQMDRTPTHTLTRA